MLTLCVYHSFTHSTPSLLSSHFPPSPPSPYPPFPPPPLLSPGSQVGSRPLSREQVSIASEMEMQNVIAFLSGSQLSAPDGYEDYERREEEFAYTDRRGYDPREYRADYDWSREKRGERPVQSDNSSSGSSGIDDPYHRGGKGYADEAVRSRSASSSGFHTEQEGAAREGGYGMMEGTKGTGEALEQNRNSLKPHLGSMDSGIHLHTDTGGKKMGEKSSDMRTDRDRKRELKENRHSQELDAFDFSREMGLLISSEPHVGHFGMDMLHKSADYQLGLELYKTMDSDSDNSG